MLGLVRILEHNGRDYRLRDDGIEFSLDILEDFHNDYFNYFSDTYEKELPWYRIVSYEEELDRNIKDIEDMDEKDLDKLNDQIDMAKDYLRRNNYKKVYPLIDGADDLDEKARDLNKINLRKKEKLEDRLEDISMEMKKLKEIIHICKTPDAKKHMRAKGVIYSHINRGWDGVSFLNRGTKHIDVFEDYKEYFINPLVDDLKVESKAKKPYECFNCGHKIDSLRDASTINLINQTGFDDTRKTSYVWNHMSDILICYKCRFLYSMISAGFNYSAYEGVFVNYSRNVEGLVEVNNSAMNNIKHMREGENNRAVSYRTIVAAIGKQHMRDLEYEQNEIQIIRYKDENYIFNILSSENIDIITKSIDDLEALERSFYKEGNDYFSVYDLVLDRIFNNQNLFTLIHFLLSHIISENSNIMRGCNIYHVSRMQNINYEILKGGLDMGKFDMKKQIYFSRLDGSNLRKEYIRKEKKSKLSGISYRLLNSLKTRNAEAFIHNVLNAYMYLDLPVPENMTIALEDEEKLGLIGYAFVTGMNGYIEKEEGDDSDEK